jgi:shikimate dehydrogenase
LRGQGTGRLRMGSDDPSGCDIIVNATPAGMGAEDPLPVQTKGLVAAMVVGDVITVPEITPLLAAARAVGCAISTGVAMFNAERDLIVEFLLGR